MTAPKAPPARGIILITTLLVLFFLVMLTTALVVSGNANLNLTGSFHDRESALHAAQAGLDYALMRLERNAYWQADDTSVPAAANGFSVTEKYLGKNIVRGELGNGEVFLVNFEHNADMFNSANNFTTYMSANNLLGQLGNEYVVTGSDGTLIRNVPKNNAYIVVRGIYNRSVRQVEAMYAYDGPTSIDSAALTSNKMSVNLVAGAKWLVSSENKELPRIRSNYTLSNFAGGDDNVSIKATTSDPLGVNVDLSGGEAVARGDIDLGSSYNGTAEARTAVDYPIPDLTMNQIPAAQSETSLAAGTYVVTGANSVAYYSSYKEDDQGNPEYPSSSTAPTKVYNNSINGGASISNYSIRVNSAQRVQPVSLGADTVDSVAVLGASGIASVARAKLILTPSADGGEPYIKSDTGGNIKVAGELSGEGSVYCSGNIAFQGRSQLTASPEKGVSLYAGKDIVLRSIEGGVDQDVSTSKTGSVNSDVARALTGFLHEELGSLPSGAKPRIPTSQTGSTLKDVMNSPYVDSRGQHWDTFKEFMQETYNIKPQDARTLLQTLLSKNSQQVTELSLSSGKTTQSWMVDLDSLNSMTGTTAQSSQGISPQDMIFMGLIYTKGNFLAYPGGNVLSITGALVANGMLGDVNSGLVMINGGGNFDLHYDPSYLKLLNAVATSCRVKRLFWNVL